MTEGKFEVLGVEETNAAFNELSRKVVNDLQPAQKVAELGAAGARSNAPVRTGELASQYSVQDRYVVNDMDYALFVEVGTAHMDAQYPIQRSLDAIEKQAEEIYNDWVMQQARETGFDTTG